MLFLGSVTSTALIWREQQETQAQAEKATRAAAESRAVVNFLVSGAR